MRISAPHKGAHQRKHFVDAGEQQRPGVAGSARWGGFGGGWIWRGCQWRRRSSWGERGDGGAQGRVGCQHAVVAVAVGPRRRDECGEAVEQLQRGEAQRSGAAGTGWRCFVEQVLRVKFVQPVQGERWPGAIAQQALTSGTVSGLDAHRGVDREAAAVFPCRHHLRVLCRQQAAPHEPAQQPPAHRLLHLRDGVGIEVAGGMEDHSARGGLEHTVDDDTVKMQMRIEGRAEAVDDDRRAWPLASSMPLMPLSVHTTLHEPTPPYVEVEIAPPNAVAPD